MTTVHQVLASSAHALPAWKIARLAGVQIEDAYAELVAMEARGQARVVMTYRCESNRRIEAAWERGAD